VNLEDERVLLLRVEARRRDDPPLDLALVLRRLVPDLLDGASARAARTSALSDVRTRAAGRVAPVAIGASATSDGTDGVLSV
jgi:hypothetical protein